MFKKLKNRIYNKKTMENLQSVEFDSFAYCGYNEYPMFVRSGTQHTNHLFFQPQTNETFLFAFEKLKKSFFKNCDFEEIENRIKVYRFFVEIDNQTFEKCIEFAKKQTFNLEENNQNNL